MTGRGEIPHESGAYERLRRLQQAAGLPDELRLPAARLTKRADENRHLPHVEDPLEDARRLIDGLPDPDRQGRMG